VLQVEIENRRAVVPLVLRDQNLERRESILVYRGGEKLFDIGERQANVAVSDPPNCGHREPDESIAMPVLALAGLEEPRQIAGAFRVGRGSEFVLEIG
jgi:hypothetical protein